MAVGRMIITGGSSYIRVQTPEKLLTLKEIICAKHLNMSPPSYLASYGLGTDCK